MVSSGFNSCSFSKEVLCALMNLFGAMAECHVKESNILDDTTRFPFNQILFTGKKIKLEIFWFVLTYVLRRIRTHDLPGPHDQRGK